jgi:perosamine synthetase
MERGIATSVHYYPNNRYPLFESFRGETPVAFEVADQILTLPVFPDLSGEEQDFIVASVLEIVESMAPEAGAEHG